MSYKNKFNLLNPEVYQDGGVSENTVLISIQNCFLLDLAGQDVTQLKLDICSFIDGCELQEGLYNKRHLSEGEIISISHDNLTAICSFSYYYNYDYHKKIWARIKGMSYSDPRASKKHYVHPRDMIFFGILNNNLLCKLFYPILFLIMAWSCFETYKIRPQLHSCIWEFFKTGKYPERHKMIGSDAEILSFVRCYGTKASFSFKLLKICIKFNKLKTFENAFRTYYKEDHPNVQLIETYGQIRNSLN